MRKHKRAEGTRTPITLAIAVLLAVAMASPLRAARIKDITSVQGIRSNQLYGFGLVVGLAGTGDDEEFTSEVVRNMLIKLRAGRGLPELESEDVSAVIVTAELPAFARKGTKIDATVSALDETTSLRGGTLLFSPLSGADEKVYAVAQGAISVGGYHFAGAAADIQAGHPTVGIVPGGAVVEKEVPTKFLDKGNVTFCLRKPDFTTATRIAAVINKDTRCKAQAQDAATVRVKLSATENQNEVMQHISKIQTLEVQPDSRAIVVINERTGTVVAGQNVSISTVAVSHGNLTVITRERPEVSQPQAFSETGETVVVPRTDIRVVESPLQEGGLTVLNKSTTVSEVARALNLLGASPRDIISIFQAMKEAGALHAELKIM